MGDLDGLLVVSVEQAVAAPYLSSRLAEAGARVIKIERPEGDFARAYDTLVHGESAYFVWLNRGKESVCLDLRQDEDKRVLEGLIAKADVFIQNLAPDAIDRLGFAPARLRAAYPRLITVSISGYGDEGEMKKARAYDLLVQAETGLVTITGNPAGPARVGVSVCDISCGMTAHQSVLQALFARERTGEGRHIAVSLFHALSDWMNVPYLQYVYGDVTPPRAGLHHPSIAPYGAYAGRDGKEVLFAVQNEREWVRLCNEVLKMPEVATDPRFVSGAARVANRPALDEILNSVFSRHDRDDLAAMLTAAQIANGRVNGMDDLARHPQNRYVEADTPSGPVRFLAPGATVNGASPAFGPVPALGEHTAAVRAEILGEQ